MRFSPSLALVPLLLLAFLTLANGRSTKSRRNSKRPSNSDDTKPSCNGSPANCNLSLMQGYVFPGTHNSGTSTLDPNPALAAVSVFRPIYCTTECQASDISSQFQDGIRAFHLELCDAADAKKEAILFDTFQKKFANPVPNYTDDDPVVCHGTEPLWGYGPLLSIVFQDLQDQLSKSNNQIVRIVLEFRQGNTTNMLNRAVQLFTNIFCDGDSSCPIAIQFSELYNKNPTLGQLTSNITNRILFTNPALTYYPTDGTLPAVSGYHYSVPWVLQDYLACNYDSGSDFNEIISHQMWECQTDASAYMCTYYGGQDQIIYHRPVPWKIQGQIGFAVKKEECIGTYAASMNSNTGVVSVLPSCQTNKNNAGQVEIDYYNQWSGDGGFIPWINKLNYNTSVGNTWGTVY